MHALPLSHPNLSHDTLSLPRPPPSPLRHLPLGPTSPPPSWCGLAPSLLAWPLGPRLWRWICRHASKGRICDPDSGSTPSSTDLHQGHVQRGAGGGCGSGLDLSRAGAGCSRQWWHTLSESNPDGSWQTKADLVTLWSRALFSSSCRSRWPTMDPASMQRMR